MVSNEITQADRELLAAHAAQLTPTGDREFKEDEHGSLIHVDSALRAIAAARRQGQVASGGEVVPVAWRTRHRDVDWSFTTRPHPGDIARGIWQPLYTSPPSAPVEERPSREAAEIVVGAWLLRELGCEPAFALEEDGADGWAFWITEDGAADDTTSYLHADLSVEWYGTSWEPSAPVGVEGPLSVFSAGEWKYSETGQTFSAKDLDEAAFVVYRDHLAQQSAEVLARLEAAERANEALRIDVAEAHDARRRAQAKNRELEAALAQQPAAVDGVCESAADDCGPVAHYDSDGVPLCERCYRSLEASP